MNVFGYQNYFKYYFACIINMLYNQVVEDQFCQLLFPELNLAGISKFSLIYIHILLPFSFPKCELSCFLVSQLHYLV